MMKSFRHIPTLLAGSIAITGGAIITPQTGTAIDPVGGEQIDTEASNSATLSDFNELSGLITQSDWAGIGGSTGNTIDGSDIDVRIDHSAGNFSASAASWFAYNTTNSGTGYRWIGTTGQQLTVRFGTHGGSFTNDRAVQAAGFVLLNFGRAYPNVTVTYLNVADEVLSTQSFAGAPDLQGTGNGGEFFTGHISETANIAKITIDIERNEGTSEIALDALSYVSKSVIPEIATPLELTVVNAELVENRFEIEVKGFDPLKQYWLKRGTDLATGFPTQVGEAFTPTSVSDTLTDPAPPAGRAFYRIEEAPAPRPNMVVILMDDFGYNDLGVQTWPNQNDFFPNTGPTPKPNISSLDLDLPAPNEARLLTPVIDAMAAEGMRLTSFYASSKCSPTRASLLTGRYDRRVDVNYVFWPDGRNGGGLNTSEVTLPETLRELGYATSLIGKWHLGYQIGANSPFQLMPRRHGFEEFYGLPHSNGMTDLALIENETILDPDFSTPAEQAKLTWRYTERTLDFIERKTAEEQPFFVMLSHTMPHIPVYPSDQTFANADGTTWPKFEGSSGVSSYYDIVKETDHSVDRILSRLKTLGIDDNTIVIFTSDNGPWTRLSEPNLLDRSVGSAYPLRDSKLTTWEGGCRVPFIVRWPGVVPAGEVSDETVGMIDLFPTLVSLAGGAQPRNRIMDGVNLRPLFSGQDDWEQPREHYALFEQNTGTLGAVIKGHWKLRAGKLYNLANDIQENNDLASSRPEKLAELMAAENEVNTSISSEFKSRGVFTDFEVQLDTDTVDVPIGGSANFQIRLSGNPQGNVAVIVARFSGSADLSVTSQSPVIFNSGNWNDWQSVTLAAAADSGPSMNGATFRLTSPQINAVREVFATKIQSL